MPLLDRLLGRRKKVREIRGEPEGSSQVLLRNPSYALFHGPVSMNDHLTTIINNSTTINHIEQGKPGILPGLPTPKSDIPYFYPVMKALARKMTPGADVDSSARHPPPKCYPGTRITLTIKIQNWLFDEHRSWDMLWLHGPAGVGKSAVAQTIAEFARDNHRLGAAFFFSKTNGRNLLQPIFITLAYQLAVRFPGYLPLVAKQLATDPDLLTKAPPVQFKRLIVEPLSSLAGEAKYLIILDGLDECYGEQAQLEIIELINNLILSRTRLPIIWMICSRPEPHIMYALSRADFAIECWREELPIDTEESRDDNAKFIRARFKEIHSRYKDCVEEDTNGSWPSEDDITSITSEASGLFVFANTILKYIEDPEFGCPNARLVDILTMIRHSHVVGGCNPLETLDLFYTQILSGVPVNIWSITRRILSVCIGWTWDQAKMIPWCLSSFLGITRSDFYAALRNLHSVLDIPPLDKAATEPLRFFHKSFHDYLDQPSRSGRFCITFSPNLAANDEMQKASLRFVSSFPGAIFADPRRTGRAQPTETQIDQVLKRCLTWPPPDPLVPHHFRVRYLYGDACYWIFTHDPKLATGEHHQELQSMLRAFDFNCLGFSESSVPINLSSFIRWINTTSLHGLVRTHSTGEIDDKLLSRVTGRGRELLDLNFVYQHELFQPYAYFLLGYGRNTVLASVYEDEYTVLYWCSKTPSEMWPGLRDLLAELEGEVLN